MKKVIGGVYKQQAIDFEVSEVPYEPIKDLSGPFVNLRVRALNWEKFLLMKTISKKLGINSGDVHIAGIKDKKALTTQNISIRVAVDRIHLLEEIPNFEILSTTQTMHPLRIGDLRANKFRVTIRDTEVTGESLKTSLQACINKVNSHGVLNLFDSQRMGFNDCNVRVGEALRQKNYPKAIALLVDNLVSLLGHSELLLTPEKKLILIKGKYPTYIERLYGEYLSTGNAKIAIMRNLPPRLRVFYLSAYQSSKFNDNLFNHKIARWYCPFDRYFNLSLEDKVRITNKNALLFKWKVLNREGEYCQRVGQKSFRPIRFFPEEMDLESIELNKYTISFRLPKGCYATILLKELINAPVV